MFSDTPRKKNERITFVCNIHMHLKRNTTGRMNHKWSAAVSSMEMKWKSNTQKNECIKDS